MDKDKTGIVGLGLIGGSLGMALRGGYTVKGLAHRREDAEYALAAGIADEIADGLEDLGDCRCIIVCTPLSTVREFVEKLAAMYPDAIISDVGSVKGMLRGIKGRVIGGHPMAGTEKSGVRAAKERLLENAYYILTDYNGDAEALEYMKALVRVAGALPVTMDAETHDRMVSKISHLVHMAAYSLVQSTMTGDEKIVGTGFMDTTRIASSSPEFWNTVARLNRDNIVSDMDDYIRTLSALRDDIAAGRDITGFLSSAKNKRDKLVDRRRFMSEYTIYADVPDCVGSIAGVLTKLTAAGINIENLSVVHSREGSGGALRLELSCERDYKKAKEILG